MPAYKIAMIASECVPFIKTGGLADVVGGLPMALKRMGHEVIVILPKYSTLSRSRYPIDTAFESLGVWMGDTLEWCKVFKTSMPGNIPVYLVEFEKYFNRFGLYHDAEFNDYADNPRRYAFFTRAALQICKDLPFEADIVHLHDWPTALGAAYLKVWHWNDAILGRTASVLTIHNIGYQGVYPAHHFPYLGLQWMNFVPERLEDHGNINMLKGGIVYADMVTTVSPTYEKETRTPDGGRGMAPYLNNKGSNYVGIVNGVDYTEWNPVNDPLIQANFSADNLEGKKICKQELQKRMLLTQDETIPIIGIVSRFVDQKGLDVLAQAIEDVVKTMQVQFAILGSGEKHLEQYFGNLPARYPGKIGSYIGYDNQLAHWIEAGSDLFIMPSRYEPCGLNQIYSLKYGTLPIVRATGGLDDTVEQYDERTGGGTGFKFWDLTPVAVYYSIGWAVSTYYDRREHFNQMVRRAMAQSFSWEESAEKYEAVYQRAIQNKRGG